MAPLAQVTLSRVTKLLGGLTDTAEMLKLLSESSFKSRNLSTTHASTLGSTGAESQIPADLEAKTGKLPTTYLAYWP